MSSLNEKGLTTGSKSKHKVFLDTWLEKRMLGSNMKTTYYLGMKNMFKSYIIGVLLSMINVYMQYVVLPSLFFHYSLDPKYISQRLILLDSFLALSKY